MIHFKPLLFLTVSAVLSACGGNTKSATTTAVVEPEAAAVHIIQPDQIPDYITKFVNQHQQVEFQFEGVKYDISFRDFGENNLSAIAQFDLGYVVIGFDIDNNKPIANVSVLETLENGDLKRNFQSAAIEVIADGDNFIYTGTVKETVTQGLFTVRLVINESFFEAGSSTVVVEDKTALVNGTLGTKTYIQIDSLIKNHPEVTSLVLQQIDGSINDAINMHTGRLIRNAQLTTLIPADGDVNSGGVDLFAAGVKRQYRDGGKVGVHSWCCVDGKSAHLLPQDHSAHGAQLTYFREMLGKTAGPTFYFFTINAANFDNIHVMTASELTQYLINE